MKQHTALVAVSVWVGATTMIPADAPPDALWDTFRNPPREARASCYWWWKDGLTAGEMGRQLRVLREAGLGGAHIIPWRSDPAYLSPEWLTLLRAAADAAKQEGMILDMSANSSWPFRGSWVSEAESLHKVALEVHPVEGPRKFSLPARATEGRRKRGASKDADTGEGPPRILRACLAPDPVHSMDQMRDVTADLAGKDAPGVDVPAGRHAVHVVRLMRGVKTQPVLGRVPDHFNPAAIENYLKGFAERVAPALGGSLSNGLRALYCDSIEISEANWTPGLPEEFRRRCGYDLMPYLPLVLRIDAADRPPAAGDSPLDATVARVRHDYCRTLTDLFLEGLAHPFYRWCHENGVLCRWQAYGWPWFYGIEDGYLIPDMPEGNSWLFAPDVFNRDVDVHGWPVWQKYTSSGAHQAGRRIASTEAMTVTQGKFQETLDQVKRADDFNFICGINHSFLHGFCYSPADAPFPGRSQYGTYFSEQNTWWPYMRRWMDYNARLSAVFQSSRPVAHVALLFRTADVWGEAGLHRHPFQMDPPWAHQVWRWINQNGASADYVSDRILQQATFADGKIASGPMRYDALVVLGARTLVPATAEALGRYARAGGRIVFAGDVPQSSPGLRDAPANDRKVRGIVDGLLREYPRSVFRRDPPGAECRTADAASWADLMDRWRKGTSPGKCLAWADQLLADLEVRRSVQLEAPCEGLYHVHYRHEEGRDLYFFANTAQSDITARVAFPLAGKRLESWDPELGVRGPFPVDGDGRVVLRLPPAGSLLLVAGAGEAVTAAGAPAPSDPVSIREITGPWSASFRPAHGEAFEIAPFELSGLHLSREDRLSRFSGQVVYRTRFSCGASAGTAVHLDLGEVPNCVTEATLNGRPLGTRWYGRHRYDAAGALRQGENQLEVKAVTTLFNCLRKAGEEAAPSGLIGPVILRTTIRPGGNP